MTTRTVRPHHADQHDVTVAVGRAAVEAAPFSLGYVRSLDGVRGVAVLAVILGHAGVPLMRGGFLGVDMFFVLSGFLITGLLLNEWAATGEVQLPHFYVRRALRLFPALSVVLGIYAVYFFGVKGQFLTGHWGPMWQPFAATLFYVSNWIRAYRIISLDMLDHTWSLAIEEQFYLLWPSALALMLRRNTSRGMLVAVVTTGIVASSVARAMLWAPGGEAARAYNGLDTRAESLLIGALAAILLFSGVASRAILTRIGRAGWMPSLGIVAFGIATCTWNAKGLYHGGGTLFALAVVVVVIALVTEASTALSRVFACSALVWVGKISYGLYLYHYPIFQSSTLAAMKLSGTGKLLIAAILTLAVATISFYLLERPLLQLKAQFRRTGDVA